MKAKYILILGLILLSSCAGIIMDPKLTEFDHDIFKSGIKEIAHDILENPDKLLNIKENYPQFYDSTILLSSMNDNRILKGKIERIKKLMRSGIFENRIQEYFGICPQYQVEDIFRYEEKINIDITKEKILMFSFIKEMKSGLDIFFIRRSSKYCIVYLSCGAVSPFD